MYEIMDSYHVDRFASYDQAEGPAIPVHRLRCFVAGGEAGGGAHGSHEGHGILVDPTQPDHLVAADVRAGPVSSSDGGRTWTALGGLLGAAWVTWSADRAALIASGPRGAARSTDGGRSWEPLTLPDGAVMVEATSGSDATLYAGGLVGRSARVWVSHDAGRTWGRP